MIEQTVWELEPVIGVRPACRALGAAPATIYRRRRPPEPRAPRPRPAPARALGVTERQALLEVLHSERFVDCAPATVWASLLDEGVYLASERTMYRLLAGAGELRERRAQRRHPAYWKPQLLATGPNELWSWDITKLPGPAKWTGYHLYVILDVFSRYVVGWMVAARESAVLAQRLIGAAQAGHRPGHAHHPRRPGLLHALKAGGVAAGRPGRGQDPHPALHLDRQSLLGGPLQDPQVPPGLPNPIREHPRRPNLLPGVLPLVQP